VVRQLPPLVRPAITAVFTARRAWYRLRYPRLHIGRDAVLLGRIRIKQGTRVYLGDRVRIRQRVSFTGGGTVAVGSDTLLNGCWIVAASRVQIGEFCLISDCGITDNDYHHLNPERRHDPPTPSTTSPVVVGRNVWIGLRALVLKGVSVGADSVVGAAAVVRSDVPARCVVAGNPAQIVKRFDPPEGPENHTPLSR
jgi:acetyltransferase-like isoleucine patch superfamily enzyme